MKSLNIKTVLASLNDEVAGDSESVLKKLTEDYSMTWIYKSPKTGELFPRTAGAKLRSEIEETYKIADRHYEIKNIAEGENVVMVELVESYPDPDTGKVFRTPLVLVLEMENGKIKTGRHYCDPNLSYLNLSDDDVNKAFL